MESDLRWSAKELNEVLIVNVRGVLGGDESDLKEISRRVVSYGQTVNCWPFWGSAADPSHVEIITETLGLRRAEGTKTCDFNTSHRPFFNFFLAGGEIRFNCICFDKTATLSNTFLTSEKNLSRKAKVLHVGLMCACVMFYESIRPSL